MPPVKPQRNPRTSSENAGAITIKRQLFKDYTQDREVKRALMKGMQRILDLVAADKAVLCLKPENEDADDITIMKVMKKEDVVEGTPEIEEKTGDKTVMRVVDKEDVVEGDEHADCPCSAAEANEKPTANDTESETQPEESQDAAQTVPESQGSMPYTV